MTKKDFERISELRGINENEPLYLYYNDKDHNFSVAYKVESYETLYKQIFTKLTLANIDGVKEEILTFDSLSREPLYDKTNVRMPDSIYIKDKNNSYTACAPAAVFTIVKNYPEDFNTEDILDLMESLYAIGLKKEADVLYNIVQGRKETEGYNLYQMKNDVILNDKIFFDEKNLDNETCLDILYDDKNESVVISLNGISANTIVLDKESFLDISEKNFVNVINQTRFYAQETEHEEELN